MTKADLVEHVVRVVDVSKKHAETIVNTVFASIVDALQGDDIAARAAKLRAEDDDD